MNSVKAQEGFKIPDILISKNIGKVLPFDVYTNTVDGLCTVFNCGDLLKQSDISRINAAGLVLKTIKEDEELFHNFLKSQLPSILLDNSIPLKEKNDLFIKNLYFDLIDTFKNKIPKNLKDAQLKSFVDLVLICLDKLRNDPKLLGIKELFIHNHVTYIHSLSVFTLALPIIRTKKVTKNELFNRGMGALLHDIGKLSIPNEILNKPGKLDDNEFKIIQEHPGLGYIHCLELTLEKQTIDAIFLHHEKFNGKGYPLKIKGEKIPVPIRIITVADVFDALCSDRPYSKAMTPQQAIEIMQEHMEGDFDPVIFKEFCEMLEVQGVIKNPGINN